MKSIQHILILILIFLALHHEKSSTLARRVKQVDAVTTKKEMATVEGDFSLGKENGGVDDEEMKGRKVWEKTSVGDDRKDNLMAFSSDYHPPKPHPPKNN